MKKAMFILLILLTITNCYKSREYETISTDDILALSTDAAAILADGVSTLNVTAHIPANADPSKRAITFETNGGKWRDNSKQSLTLTVNVNGDALAELQSDTKPQNVRIRASIPNVIIQEVNVTFDKAYPETIVVDPGCFGLKASYTDTTLIKAILKRTIGNASEGTDVSFSAIKDNGESIGSFRTITSSNSNGEATALYCIGTTTYEGQITIIASIATPNGTITGSATITIIK